MPSIPDRTGVIKTEHLDDKCVTTEKLRYKAVGREQLGDKAVGINELGDKAVGSKQLQPRAVGSAQIALHSINREHINPDFIPLHTNWQPAELQNEWHDDARYNTPGFCKDAMGFVHLRGVVCYGTDRVIFQLPPGYRPIARELHTVSRGDGTSDVLGIDPDGSVNFLLLPRDPFFSLDGITFGAASEP